MISTCVQAELSHDALFALTGSHQKAKATITITVTVRANLAPVPSHFAAPTPLMVVSAPTTTLLLAASVVAAAAEALAIVSIRAAAVLVAAGTAGHTVAAAVHVMSLQMTGVACVARSAHLRVLRRRETALAAGSVVGGRSGSRPTSQSWGRTRGVCLGVTKGLQVVGSPRCRRLVLAVERLALRLIGRRTTGEAIMGSTVAAGAGVAETRLAASLSRTRAAIVTQSGAEAAVTVKRGGRAGKSARRRRVVIRSIRGHCIRLSIHATLATVGAEASLSVARVVLVIVRVAVVRVAVAGILSVGLRL